MSNFPLLNELLNEQTDDAKLENWKAAVKKANPDFAAKMKFKGRREGGKDMICAEVPGLDRCFGVFDLDKMKGEVLGEGKRSPGEKCFLVKSKRHNKEMKVYAKDTQQALDRAAVKDDNHYFTGPVGKDVTAVEVDEKMEEALLAEKRPAGAPKWHDSDAPDANGKFKELGVNDLADWLIKTRGGDMQKINGSLQQQIVFNRKKDPSYAKKMESVREAVKRKLAKKD